MTSASFIVKLPNVKFFAPPPHGGRHHYLTYWTYEEIEPFVCRSYGQCIVHRGTVDIPRDKVGRKAGTLEKSSAHENKRMIQSTSDGVASHGHRGTVDIPREKVGRKAGTLEKSSTHENKGMKQNTSDGVASHVHRGTVDIPRNKVGRQAGTLEKSSTHEIKGMKQNTSDGVASQIHHTREDRVSSSTKKADSSFLYRLSKFLGICKEDESNVSGSELLESTEVGAILASEDDNSKEKRQESKDIPSSDESPRSLIKSSSLADLSAFTGSLSRRCVSFDGVSECLDDPFLSVSPKWLRGYHEHAGRSVSMEKSFDSVQVSQNTSNREFENDLRFLSTCGNKTSTPERPKSVIQKPRRRRMLNFNHASIPHDHVGLTSPLRTCREQRFCNNWPPRHFCQSLPNIIYDTTKVSGNFNQTEPVACSVMPRNSKEFFGNCRKKNTFPFERGHTSWLNGEHRQCLVDDVYLQTEANSLQCTSRGCLGLDSSLTIGFPSDSDFKPWYNPNFRNEDEEAVYHLVTKYLENEDCKW